MATISVSKSGLPHDAQQAAEHLFSHGYAAAQTYNLTAAQASTDQITDPLLSILLRTGTPSTPTQTSIVRRYGFDTRTGDLFFILNHDLVA